MQTKCRIVAEGHGFKEVVTPGDIITYTSDTTLFWDLRKRNGKTLASATSRK
jgi:hypothetical protein